LLTLKIKVWKEKAKGKIANGRVWDGDGILVK